MGKGGGMVLEGYDVLQNRRKKEPLPLERDLLLLLSMQVKKIRPKGIQTPS